MKRHLREYKSLVATVVVAILLSACSASTRLYKKGEKLDEAGMYTEAAAYYKQALQRKQTNEKAIIAFKTAGQRVLDDMLADIYTAHSVNDYKTSVYAYTRALSYKNEASALGVNLIMQNHYKDYYEADKAKYINIVYQEANMHLENELFAEAENDFNEILKFDPDNSDVKELRKFSIAEPLYRKGEEELANSNYRAAYYTFDELLKNGTYKDTDELKAHALKKATYTIAILPFKNATEVTGAEAAINAKMLQEISESRNPFIRIIDRENLQTIIDEQLLSLGGTVDEESAIAAGELFGANAILTGTVITASYRKGKLNYHNEKGYVSKQVRVRNPANPGKPITRTVYNKVIYRDYTQVNEVSISFSYKLISAETGEILVSDVVEYTDSDHIHYSTYDGNTENLFPGYWASKNRNSPEDKVYGSSKAKRELDNELSGRRTIASVEKIAANVYRKIAVRAAGKIIDYNPEK